MWQQRRLASFAVRALGLLVPLAAGIGAALFANRHLPDAHRTITVVPRTLFVIALSMIVIAALDRTVRRLLPLATLLQLSLAFPDQAPSRLRIALHSSNRRQMRALVTEATENGLADNPALAAEQVMLLVAAMGDHYRHTRSHSERVRLYADMIGREMHLTKEDRQKLQWGALLHDLGKLHLAPSIVDKKGPLDANEWILVRRHPEQGRRLLRPLVPFLGEWAEAVWNHHERWDGTGYPRGVGGDRIGRAAAIVAVADSFEAMTSANSYKKPMTVAEARAEVTAGAETQFSPEVVHAFLSISLGRLRIAMGPLAALAHIPFLQQAPSFPSAVGASFNHGFTSAVAGAAPALAAGALSIGALVGTGAIDGAVAEPQGDAVFAAAHLSVAPGLDESANLAIAGVIAATNSLPPTTAPAAPTTTAAPPPPTAAPKPPPPAPVDEPPPPTEPPTTVTPTTVPTTTKATTTTKPPTTTQTTTTTRPPTTTAATPAALSVSTSANRTSPTALGSGNLKVGVAYYKFATSTKPITKVEFYNNATGTGAPARTETGAPYDYAGTAGGGNANPTTYSTTGTKSITIKVFYTDGTQTAKTATFTVEP
jgi:HD-GYP domain-containing protein (c-di-GMP phosphodiesterase class II)/outer membrane biosynthesis protein TonB